MEKATTVDEELIHHLSNFVSESRNERFAQVLNNRTRQVSVVLEDIYQPHNASAVLRTCDIFGIQDVHIIENRNKYTLNPDVELGSAKWLSLNKYNSEDNNTISCLNTLKEKGYKIVATTPHTTSCDIDELTIDQPTALVFGTELTGISDEVKNNADEFVRIPMYGFTESFNISVSAALCLHSISKKLRSTDISWQLSKKEKDILNLEWLRNTIKKHQLIEEAFYAKKAM